jgi:2,3-bisphosphoglycerate-independent phosphoglycerate mutase
MKKACLIVLDGWGLSCSNALGSNTKDAIKEAATPTMDSLTENSPFARLAAHGLSVGLPVGCMGNSEVGHLNIGAGRVVYQDLVRINLAIEDGNAFSKAFNQAVQPIESNTVHLVGLISPGQVHSSIQHLLAALAMAKDQGIANCLVHCITDGRDSDCQSWGKWLKEVQAECERLHYGEIASIVGRYWAMDRDQRWERTKVAFEALVNGVGEPSEDWHQTLLQRYELGETDEFLKPIILSSRGIKEGDCVFLFNFRADRMRQLAQVLVERTKAKVISMTRYSEAFSIPVLFPAQQLTCTLAECVSRSGKRQVHIAETEKYAHVTFFFNGRREEPFEGEKRILIPSPKDVATYDLKPEMSVHLVAEAVCNELQAKEAAFVMCNFAPPDMVGHTGNLNAAVQAVEATDRAIGKVWNECLANDYALFVTADHGNAEQMTTSQGNPHTAHTCADVPFVMACREKGKRIEAEGALCDVAPTILHWLCIEIPPQMTGRVLMM